MIIKNYPDLLVLEKWESITFSDGVEIKLYSFPHYLVYNTKNKEIEIIYVNSLGMTQPCLQSEGEHTPYFK